ncbi:MAG: GDP-mannose 4,6-dehydratase [Gemmatimonadetes bacterium]|nr:GDP-mannose 4,6-dehydratase [Gemmatimonadota bacterium]
MKVLVTGADGFVGLWMIQRLADDGHEIVAAVRPGCAVPSGVRWVELELRNDESVRRMADVAADAVVHLAAVASGADAREDPGEAWEVNAAGTARLLEALGTAREAGRGDPQVLVVSTGEVYGGGAARPRVETDALLPCSPYAASKVGAETAALEVGRRTGLRVVIVRAFPHTGRGQDHRFVIPFFARRLQEAKRSGDATVRVGNLEPVRDFLHVSDVVEAYTLLLTRGVPGEIYNVASGRGVSIREVFERIAALVGAAASAETDPRLTRRSDIPYLVGNAEKLRLATGWSPRVDLDTALEEVVRAEAD